MEGIRVIGRLGHCLDRGHSLVEILFFGTTGEFETRSYVRLSGQIGELIVQLPC